MASRLRLFVAPILAAFIFCTPMASFADETVSSTATISYEQLFKDSQTWEIRARKELADKRKCQKDLGSCEILLAEKPAPAETELDIGVDLDVLIYVGAGVALAAASGTVGYFIGKAAASD